MKNSETVIVAIEYDQPRDCVAVGNILSGRVILRVSQAILIRGIRIYFHGMAKASWSSVGKFNSTREVYLAEAQELFQTRHNLYTALLVQPGVHSYPFSFQLPVDLPASFRDASSSVRYKSKATVEGYSSHQKFTAEKIFLVSRGLDLNLESARLKRACRVRREICYSSGCCVVGTVSTDFTINRRCFVPFENIILNGMIENSTNRTIHKTTISIVQEVTLVKSGLKRVLKRKVSKVNGPEVPPYQAIDWNEIELLVPPVPLSRLDGCNIIHLDYSIQFSAAFRFPCSESSKTLKSIVIGDVPLQSDVESRTTPTPSSGSVETSIPVSERSVQRTSARRSGGWGTQWDMVNWMGPMESLEPCVSPSSKPSSDTGKESMSHRTMDEILHHSQTIRDLHEDQRILDSDIMLSEFI